MLDCNRVVNDSVNDLRLVDEILPIGQCCVRSVLYCSVFPLLSPVTINNGGRIRRVDAKSCVKHKTNYTFYLGKGQVLGYQNFKCHIRIFPWFRHLPICIIINNEVYFGKRFKYLSDLIFPEGIINRIGL